MKKWFLLAGLAISLAVPSLAFASGVTGGGEAGWCCPLCCTD